MPSFSMNQSTVSQQAFNYFKSLKARKEENKEQREAANMKRL